MEKVYLFLMSLLVALSLASCLSGKSQYRYQSYDPTMDGFREGRPTWEDICHLRWPGELAGNATAYCQNEHLSDGRDFDLGHYLHRSEVRTSDELKAALVAEGRYKYIEILNPITISSPLEVRGSIAFHGPGRFQFQNGYFKLMDQRETLPSACPLHQGMGQTISQTDLSPQGTFFAQSVRILIGTENLDIRTDNMVDPVHISIQAPTLGQIEIPHTSILVVSFYNFTIKTQYWRSLVAFAAKVQTVFSVLPPVILSVKSQMTNTGRTEPWPVCQDQFSENFSLRPNDEKSCRYWAEAKLSWSRCKVHP